MLNRRGGPDSEPPITPSTETLPHKSRLAALLDHVVQVEDLRDVRRILHPLLEVLLLAVCGTIADCDAYEDIAAWGAAHPGFLRRHLSCAHGVPGERWLTILMNRMNGMRRFRPIDLMGRRCRR